MRLVVTGKGGCEDAWKPIWMKTAGRKLSFRLILADFRLSVLVKPAAAAIVPRNIVKILDGVLRGIADEEARSHE